MKPSLQFRLSQHLALTPQLQQSIRLLQLSTLELNQEIEQAMADNPLLERDDDPLATSLRIATDGSIMPARAGDGGAADGAPENGALLNGSGAAGAGDSEREEHFGVLDWGATRGARDNDDEPAARDWAATPVRLRDHLRVQLAGTQTTARDRTLIDFLIEAIDDDGYLTSPLDELLALCPAEAQIEADDLSTTLRLLQSFDPAGVGARNPAECLAIQIEHLERDNPSNAPLLALAKRVVSEHLPLLAARDLGKLRKLLSIDEDTLRAVHQVIRGLNPYPGVGFGSSAADYIVPDIFLRRQRGRWVPQLNPDVMPRLRVNQDYVAIVKRDSREGRAAWSSRVQEARWLIRNVQQRFDTILRVAQAIVERQQNYFTHGEVAMRPLVLREIADAVALHESTISRVTSNKYMATPFGVFELKYFFGSHVATDTGGAASSTAIRALIKQILGVEDPKNPLSDSKVAEVLGAQGIVVARRTVAKYREALKIAPVAMRKSF